MIVSFIFYVMNFVDFVFDFYSHITSHVSQVFASCTHYTSHSLLNYVHVIVCFFWSDQPSLKIPWVLCKTYLMLENLRERIENINVWRTRFKTCVFEKHFISYSCIIFIKYNALRSFCTKLLWFFKILFFLEFRSIKPIFRSIEIVIKNFGQPLSVSIDARLRLDQSKHFRSIEHNFWSIENRIESFLKNVLHVFKLIFSKGFQLFLSPIKALIQFFVVFLHSFCKVFLS